MRSAPVRFMTALGKALSDMVLYGPGHPARTQAVEVAHTRLVELQQEQAAPVFTLLDGAVLYGSRSLPELRTWEWAARLDDAGINRFEFRRGTDRADLERFLEDVLHRLTGKESDPTAGDGGAIRYGAVGLRGLNESEEPQPDPETVGLSLGEEAAAWRWMSGEVEAGRDVPLTEAAAVVASLAVTMRAERSLMLPLLRLRHHDEYTTTHALNVAVLSMGLAEWMGMGPTSVRQLGLAGLLHDIGKVKIPPEILNKSGKLSDEERRIINSHPVHGARILFETAPDLELPSVVAYEHHIMENGSGYPGLRFTRDRHGASKLVHVCDVYDALRTDRPYRAAWPADRVLAYIAERAGTEFDLASAQAFVEMMGRWEEVRVATEASHAAMGSAAGESPGASLPDGAGDPSGGRSM